MTFRLLDTNVASILFKLEHPLCRECLQAVSDHEWLISFMTRAELLVWPKRNNWGPRRRDALLKHMGLCTTLFPDEETCSHWSDIMAESKRSGRPMEVDDAWIAATARQWDLALVTTDYGDYEHLSHLNLIPIG